MRKSQPMVVGHEYVIEEMVGVVRKVKDFWRPFLAKAYPAVTCRNCRGVAHLCIFVGVGVNRQVFFC